MEVTYPHATTSTLQLLNCEHVNELFFLENVFFFRGCHAGVTDAAEGTSGCAITQAISSRLPTEAAGFDRRSGHVEFVLVEMTLGQIFPEYLCFFWIA